MSHCAKCGAELIGSRKFCAACGTPAVDPRAAPPAGQAPAGGAAYGDVPPQSQVNPFAQTALPGTHRDKIDSMYGPPPVASAGPAISSQVSPLAASNALESRGAFSSAGAQVAAAQEALRRTPGPALPPSGPAAPTLPAGTGGMPGTQLMPSVKNPPSVPPPAAIAATAPANSKKGGGTQVMTQADAKLMAARAAHPSSGIGSPLSSPAASTGEAFARLPSASNQPAVPNPIAAPAAPAAPVPPPAPAPYPYSPSAVGAYVPPAQPVVAPAPVAPAAPVGGSPFYPGYPSYAPGARVQVTWANGQRYPGTIHQLAGHQALVVFPDGQQHWVDLGYVSPG